MNFAMEMAEKFLLDHVEEAQRATAKGIFDDLIAKQEEGKLDLAYLESVAPKLLGFMKTDSIDAVKGVLAHFLPNQV